MRYEFVGVFSSRISGDELKKTLASVEGFFGKEAILKKDDIGQLQTVYPYPNGEDILYFVSYYLDISGTVIAEIKQKLQFVDYLQRYVFYKLSEQDKLLTYKEYQTAGADLLENMESSVSSKKMEYLIHTEHLSLLSWKNTALLKKYITRFDNIKPRKFTKHGVRVQKQLRKWIIRSRELGLLPYIKHIV